MSRRKKELGRTVRDRCCNLRCVTKRLRNNIPVYGKQELDILFLELEHVRTMAKMRLKQLEEEDASKTEEVPLVSKAVLGGS